MRQSVRLQGLQASEGACMGSVPSGRPAPGGAGGGGPSLIGRWPRFATEWPPNNP
jgi:hypothetical protein